MGREFGVAGSRIAVVGLMLAVASVGLDADAAWCP